MFPVITKIKDIVFDFRRTLNVCQNKNAKEGKTPIHAFQLPSSKVCQRHHAKSHELRDECQGEEDIPPSRTSFVMSVRAKRILSAVFAFVHMTWRVFTFLKGVSLLGSCSSASESASFISGTLSILWCIMITFSMKVFVGASAVEANSKLASMNFCAKACALSGLPPVAAISRKAMISITHCNGVRCKETLAWIAFCLMKAVSASGKCLKTIGTANNTRFHWPCKSRSRLVVRSR